MYKRILDLKDDLEESVFLFGARQTGKSTLLKEQFSGAPFFDLLDTSIRSRLEKSPHLLYETLKDKPARTVVVIDAFPEIPKLLNEVHRLISEKELVFVLCGSSARKLKRKGFNTLGGRALPVYFYPLVSAEIPDFDLDRAILTGTIPSHYLAKDPHRKLMAYIDVYLKT